MKPSSPHVGSALGFGLVELCITLAASAILCAVALPSFRDSLTRARADGLRMQLHTALQAARNAAITRQQRIELCPSTDGVTCGADWARGWLIFPQRRVPAHPGTQPADVFLVQQRPPSKLRAIPSDWRDTVRFRADGRNGGANQTIPICLEGRRYSEVVVSQPGRVRSRRFRHPASCPMR